MDLQRMGQAMENVSRLQGLFDLANFTRYLSFVHLRLVLRDIPLSLDRRFSGSAQTTYALDGEYTNTVSSSGHQLTWACEFEQ